VTPESFPWTQPENCPDAAPIFVLTPNVSIKPVNPIVLTDLLSKPYPPKYMIGYWSRLWIILQIMDRQVGSLLSLSRKAGKLIAGDFVCETALRNGKACLILIAEDASDNTKKKFVNKAFYYKIPAYIYGSTDELNHVSGTRRRVVYAITDIGLAKSLKSKLFNLNISEAGEWRK
jgi:ribosomal protein L7Ae-like RNA K-turn-binding protein